MNKEEIEANRILLREGLEGVGEYQQEHVFEWIQRFITAGHWLMCDYLLTLQNTFPDYEWEKFERSLGQEGDKEFENLVAKSDFFWPLDDELWHSEEVWIFARKKNSTGGLSMCGCKAILDEIVKLKQTDPNDWTPSQKFLIIFGNPSVLKGLSPKTDV